MLPRFKTVDFAVFFIFLLIIIGASVMLSQGYAPRGTSSIIDSDTHDAKKINLPVEIDVTGQSTAEKKLIIKQDIEFKSGQSARYALITNACISAVLVNYQQVPVPQIAVKPCSAKKGIGHDFSQHFKEGKNSVIVMLYANNHDKIRFNWIGKLSSSSSNALYVLVSALAGYALFVFFRMQGRSTLQLLKHNFGSISWRHAALVTVFFTALSIVYKLQYIGLMSHDMRAFLLPWYRELQEHGWSAFERPFFNYAPLYLYLVAIFQDLFSALPPASLYKMLSMTFECVAITFVFLIMKRLAPTKPMLAVIASGLVAFSPNVTINGAMWGQCDIIYTTGLLACFYYILCNRAFRAMIWFAVACAFKQQALFFLPFILFVTYLKRISITYWLMVPSVFLITLIPAALLGRDIWNLVGVYYNQATFLKSLIFASANPYLFISNAYYTEALLIGLAVTFLAIGLIASFSIKYFINPSDKQLLLTATLVMALMPYLLPKMMDRYYFAAIVFSIPLAMVWRRYLFAAICLNLTVLYFSSYGFIPNSYHLWTPLPRMFNLSPDSMSYFILVTLANLQLLYGWASEIRKSPKWQKKHQLPLDILPPTPISNP